MKTTTEKPARRQLAAAREVADYLGISRNALYQMCSRGEGPAPLRVGTRTLRWDWDEIERWLREGTKERPCREAV